MRIRRFIFVSTVVTFLCSLLAVTACDDDDCCPVSETFTCSNFAKGGSRSLQNGVCETGLTDNLPSFTGKKIDAKGCTFWEVDPSGPRTCGAAINTPRRDAAADAADGEAIDAADASAETSVDASSDSSSSD